MTADAICTTFTYTCQGCGATAQVVDGQRQPHGDCTYENPSLVIEADRALTAEELRGRVGQALADGEELAALEGNAR